MATLVIWATRLFGLFLFAVLAVAGYNLYSPAGAVVFASVVGATVWGFQSLVTVTFKNARRGKFLREYNKYLNT